MNSERTISGSSVCQNTSCGSRQGKGLRRLLLARNGLTDDVGGMLLREIVSPQVEQYAQQTSQGNGEILWGNTGQSRRAR